MRLKDGFEEHSYASRRRRLEPYEHPLAFWFGVRNAFLVVGAFVLGGLGLYRALLWWMS